MAAPEQEQVLIAGPAGQLEALLEVPAETALPAGVAILCHPHPQHQGTMLNKVVHTLARAMNDKGFAALRFNFRGVGASAGDHDEGNGEVHDAIAVAQWARRRYPEADLWLGGFSFGALIALRVAQELEPKGLISIAPAVNYLRTEGLTVHPDRWLIVQGDADEIVPCEAVVDWVNQLEPGAQLVIMPGVGHFFHGALVPLRQQIVKFMDEIS